MPSTTRKTIKKVFLRKLKKFPVTKITIKDITDSCGISRNAFYYYYKDLPDLIDTVIREGVDEITSLQPGYKSIEDCCLAMHRAALRFKTEIMHIYKYVDRKEFENYLWLTCDYGAEACFRNVFPDLDREAEGVAALIESIKYETFGRAILWMHGGMKAEFWEAHGKMLDTLTRAHIDTLKKADTPA